MTTIGVFASIFDASGRILLVRQAYANRRWTTPGGGVESGESPVAALRREVREEIGCEIEPTHFQGVYSKLYRNDLVLSFGATVRVGTPHRASVEIADLGFFDRTKLPIEMAANSRARVVDAFNGLRSVLRIFESERSTGTLLSTYAA